MVYCVGVVLIVATDGTLRLSFMLPTCAGEWCYLLGVCNSYVHVLLMCIGVLFLILSLPQPLSENYCAVQVCMHCVLVACVPTYMCMNGRLFLPANVYLWLELYICGNMYVCFITCREIPMSSDELKFLMEKILRYVCDAGEEANSKQSL